MLFEVEHSKFASQILSIFSSQSCKFLCSIATIYVISVGYYQGKYELNSKLVDNLYNYMIQPKMKVLNNSSYLVTEGF